ncbi:cullin-associated NEDD8-dissociated protein 1 [Pungitius pungitius]|uniref:cullin-associated NEDD8-dissociated protein 1 n=1 Tax=Pungitius pungitius TaxID=134920 RepID=UPI002E105EC1
MSASRVSNVSFHVSNLLDKMTSSDKDFRFMATNDLMLELQKDSVKLDEDSEMKVVTMVLRLLEDKNGEVQNLAVRCLAPLVSKVKEPQVEMMVDTLCSNMTSDKEPLRDISSMGLKTVIAELPLSSSGLSLTVSVCKKITSQMIAALEKQEDASLQLEALDILSDMLERLSGVLVSFHSSLLSSLLLQLTSSRMAVRKRSILALGHLVPCCSPALFSQLTEHLMTELAKDPPTSMTRTYIQCLATISRQGGHQVGEHLEKLIPMVVRFICVEDDELIENCFQAFEAFIRRRGRTVPLIVKALHRQLKEKSIKHRHGCFTLLTDLSHTAPGALETHIPALIPGIIFSLTDCSTSSTMRIDALSFFHVLLLSHPPQVFQPHMRVLLPPVVACVEDSFYKITSEALLVAQQLVRVMMAPAQSSTPSQIDPAAFVRQVFPIILRRLKATDIDQEVKERAISCTGHLVCHLGDHLGAELPGVLAIFLERLRNEITRLTTVRTITLISASPLKIHLASILPETLSILGSFLRKNQRVLKLAALACLTALVEHHAAAIEPAALEPVLSELPALLDESDMHVSQVSIFLLTSMSRACSSSVAKICSSVLPGVFRLVHSPLLQGGALAAILDFLQALVQSKASNLGYSQLLKSLTDPFHTSQSSLLHKQSYQSVARCVAALASSCPSQTPAMVSGLLQEAKNPGSPESARVLALLCLGEVGRSGSLGASKEVQGVILEAISSANEEVKTAASCALGSMAVGSLNDYLPFLLKEISSQPRRQYLLLHSLKEVISACPASSLSPHVEPIWTLLFQYCECDEEGTRNLVAECLGKLTLVKAAQLLPRLRQHITAGSPLTRSTVLTAVKFTIVDQPAAIDALLRDCMGDFLKTLQDEDINVRRVSLVMFNSAVHNKPSLIRGLLATVLPHLYRETRIRKDLIREVEMGPFKHSVDEGLDLRKAAFEVMYSLLDGSLEGLDLLLFLDHVEEGLKDHYDIRMLTFLMLARLASLCPAAVLQRLDRLIEPLKATCTTKVKAGSVKQEFEKQEELRRSAMRAVAALLAVPGVERSPSAADFANQIRANADMASIYQSVQGGEGGQGPVESMDLS